VYRQAIAVAASSMSSARTVTLVSDVHIRQRPAVVGAKRRSIIITPLYPAKPRRLGPDTTRDQSQQSSLHSSHKWFSRCVRAT